MHIETAKNINTLERFCGRGCSGGGDQGQDCANIIDCKSIVLCQDATMQKRMDVAFQQGPE